MERLLEKGLSAASMAMAKAGAWTMCDAAGGQDIPAGFERGCGPTLIEAMLPLAVAAGLAILACAAAPEGGRDGRGASNPYGAMYVAA